MNFASLEMFAETLKAKFSLPGSASPEDQLKPVVADLFEASAAHYGLKVETRTETHLSAHKVRPDIAIYVGGLICGYVELKQPGLGADAPRSTDFGLLAEECGGATGEAAWPALVPVEKISRSASACYCFVNKWQSSRPRWV